ncbi:hypothetical protein MMC29_003582 [Sticta canariensis]|nr:hypothetical protein [Sticta canariensis]
MLKTIAFLEGHKWTSMMVKRVYFGNWLRDYSQAVDVGTLKGIQSGTIRILVWVLSFLSFGYATAEFEVTEERLGVYRPEEHIDNPKDYADNNDARKFDPRLRPPIQPIELEVDLSTGMKNYIANDNLGIATSSGYVGHSFSRSIHFGRVYTSGAGGSRGKEADLCEALRCLGQGLHCLEDFGAHTNYTELALRELGYKNVFPHTGTATGINLRGQHVFPLVTGTFGTVDFLHSVLGEATDHFAQTEIDQLDVALGDAQSQSKPSSGKKSADLSKMKSMLSQVGAGSFVQQAEYLQAQSDAQAQLLANSRGAANDPLAHGMSSAEPTFDAPPGSIGGPPGPGIPGMSSSFDPMKTAAQIYPILEFRDKVVRAISATIEKVPGLEALVEKVTETLTIFVLSLLAPFIRPIINAVSAQLKNGSSGVVDASGKHQYEPWTNPHCSDPTHSLLSKDHFSNILNPPAGQIAACILQYVAPRIIYAWQHPDIPVQQVLQDVTRVFHHPALRDNHCEVHRNMFEVVKRWAHSSPNGGAELDHILSSESVRQGKNHIGGDQEHSHGSGFSSGFVGSGTHSKVSGAPWEKLYKMGNATGVGRDGPDGAVGDFPAVYPGTATAFDNTRPPTGPAAGYTPGPSEPAPPYQQNTYGYPPPHPPPQEHDYSAPPSAPSWDPTYPPASVSPGFDGFRHPGPWRYTTDYPNTREPEPGLDSRLDMGQGPYVYHPQQYGGSPPGGPEHLPPGPRPY